MAAPSVIRDVMSLASGDRLTRPEFERRYAADPRVKKAELIEGVVYVASPVSLAHANAHSHMLTWLGLYSAAQPGVVALTEPTVRLDLDNEPQPDVVLARRHIPRPPQQGQYFEGVPELVVEIAASSASYDLHDKLNAYRRNGVQEYIVWRVYEEAIDWFALREGEYKPLAADAAGVVASEVFPGLRLDVKAMLAGDIAAVLKAQSVTA